MITLEDALADYFGAYRERRIDDILEWFLLPCHFVSDADEVRQMPLPTKEAIRVGVQRVLDWRRDLGVARGRIVKQAIL